MQIRGWIRDRPRTGGDRRVARKAVLVSRRLSPFVAAVLVGVSALVTACGSGTSTRAPIALGRVNPLPPGAAEITSAPHQRGDKTCDATASLRPGPLPPPGSMPPGSAMAKIVTNGRVRVGVEQNTYLFGFRNPQTGQVEGFDIDLAREIARALFGDPERIELRTVPSAERIDALRDNEVDLIVNTFSATCERAKDVDFSSVYYVSAQRILVAKNSGIRTPDDLAGKRVCAAHGSTSAEPLFALPARPTVIGTTSWTDCLAAIQQGHADAVSTDETILHGLAMQDANLEVVGDPLGRDNYAIGLPKGNSELVRFVNGVLDRIRSDGTWDRMYRTRLSVLGPSPGPPAPRYRE